MESGNKARLLSRNMTFALALVASFMAGFATLGTGTADAAFARVSGATGCHPHTNMAFWGPNSDEPHPTVERGVGGLKINSTSTRWQLLGNNGNVWGMVIRCDVPSNSGLDHENISTIRVYGRLQAVQLNNVARRIKSCSVHRQLEAGYACTRHVNVPGSGMFAANIPVTSSWGNYRRFPMVVAVMGYGDEIRGVTYTDG